MHGFSDYDTRHNLDWDALDSEASEMSWGSGLEPLSVRAQPPAEGGRYKGREATVNHPPDPHVPVSRDLRI